MHTSKAAATVLCSLALLAGCGKKPAEQSEMPPATESASPSQPGGTTPSPSTEAGGPIPVGADPRLSDPLYLKQLNPSADRDIAIGNAYLQHGDLDSASVYYRHAVDQDPKNVRAWNFLGICLARLERLDEAEAAYKQAAGIDAFYAKTHSNLGNLYLKRNDLDAAVAAYRRASTIDSTDVTNWLNLGLAYRKKEEWNGAILSYRKAADCDPASAEPWSRLGFLYYDQGLYKAARESWEKAIDRDPARQDLVDAVATLKAYAESTGTR